ncbi:hypothetical protein [Actinoplanes regularis]|nr:hypothetical protein [Actinoplanes regularis]GIE90718.1 hypothetical protein Are01nite_71980 [Actinoplanes regularis]
MKVVQHALRDVSRGADAEQLIGALIPPATRRRPTPGSPVPLPPVPVQRLPVDASPESLRLGMARPDASGRLSLRYLLRTLGWSPGDRVDHTVIDQAIVVTRSPTGRAVIGTRGDLMIPATARALAGLDPDGQVVLVAAPTQDTLVIHAEHSIAELIAAHYVEPDTVDDD